MGWRTVQCRSVFAMGNIPGKFLCSVIFENFQHRPQPSLRDDVIVMTVEIFQESARYLVRCCTVPWSKALLKSSTDFGAFHGTKKFSRMGLGQIWGEKLLLELFTDFRYQPESLCANYREAGNYFNCMCSAIFAHSRNFGFFAFAFYSCR